MAAALVLTQIRAQLQVAEARSGPDRSPSGMPCLGVLYITDAYAPHAQDLLDHLMAALPEVTDWVGTVGVGIAANGVEYFDEPAMALMLMDMAPTQYRVFSGVAPLPPSGHAEPDGFSAATALVHADASTPDVADLVVELAQRTSSGYVFGGLASSRTRSVQFAHSSRGALAGQGAVGGVFEGGLSGVAFGQSVALVSRVTQGCTPVGPVRTLTRAEGNVALELDGADALGVLLGDLDISLDQPEVAMARLRSTFVGLSPAAHFSPQPSPHLLAVQGGGALTARHGQFGTDVRVRHLIGLDPMRKGVAVADALQAGERLAFCARNPQAARADLMRVCAELREELESSTAVTDASARATTTDDLPVSHEPRQAVRGAIYVSCAGRGGPHFGGPSAELLMVRRALGDVPLVGFFAGGEIAHQQLYGYSGVLTVFVSDLTIAPSANV